MKLIVRGKKCKGCQLCELACSATKSGRFSINQSRIRVLRRKDATEKIIVCHQCKGCKCLKACNYNAFKRDAETGGVYIDEDECQACFACIDACPLGAVRMNHGKQTPTVCDLCGGSPSCVELCPSNALAVAGS